MKNVALVLAGLLAGAVAGTVLVPWVRAEGPRPVVVRWQQFCDPASSITEASTISRARGLEGYELVGFFGGALCFKRPSLETPREAPKDAPKPGNPPPADSTSPPGREYGI